MIWLKSLTEEQKSLLKEIGIIIIDKNQETKVNEDEIISSLLYVDDYVYKNITSSKK